MSFEVIPTPNFSREFKKLAKKYPSLADDLAELIGKLEKVPA